jgi:hypothetical protein
VDVGLCHRADAIVERRSGARGRVPAIHAVAAVSLRHLDAKELQFSATLTQAEQVVGDQKMSALKCQRRI